MPTTRSLTTSCGRTLWGAAIGIGLVLQTAQASAEAPDGKSTKPEVKSVIGALAMYRPEYPGGADSELVGLPFIDLQYNQYFFNPINGAGVGIRPIETLTVGLGLGYAFGRDQDDADRLEGLGDIDGGAKVSFFADYKFKLANVAPGFNGSYTLGLTLDHQFTGDDTGVSGDLGLSRSDRLGDRFLLVNGVSAFFGSDSFQEAWFAVSERQSIRSALPSYDSDDLVHAAGLSTRLLYFVSRELSLITAVSYKRLIDEAEDSPVVESQDQMSYQLGFTYTL